MSIKLATFTAGVCLTVMGCLVVAHAVTLEVKEGNSTCIKAELSANFSITYTTTNGTNTVSLALPGSTVVGGNSTCGGEAVSPRLVALFADGHALTLAFSSDGHFYRVANLSLQYNLNDNSTFPQSNSTGIVSRTTDSSGISARLNSTYRCLSSSTVTLGGAGVTVTFSNVRMEAYMTGGNLSTDETICSADQTPTTAQPKTTPAPSPVPPGIPERGNYTITIDNKTSCLLALMGLQLNITYFSKSQNKNVTEIRNLKPNTTSFTGSCGVTVATLMLTEDLETTNLNFTFRLNSTTQKFHLSALSVSAKWPDMKATFTAENSSLNYLQGSTGRSFMCSAEQTLAVVPSFSLNTFRLQLQPFNVTGNQFAKAEECRVDQENMLIPIIVGAALAGLVLIVLIAYLIGRKRTHAGYQTI